MVLSDEEIQHRLLELIEAKGPFNWYNLEIRVPIDPGQGDELFSKNHVGRRIAERIGGHQIRNH